MPFLKAGRQVACEDRRPTTRWLATCARGRCDMTRAYSGSGSPARPLQPPPPLPHHRPPIRRADGNSALWHRRTSRRQASSCRVSCAAHVAHAHAPVDVHRSLMVGWTRKDWKNAPPSIYRRRPYRGRRRHGPAAGPPAGWLRAGPAEPLAVPPCPIWARRPTGRWERRDHSPCWPYTSMWSADARPTNRAQVRPIGAPPAMACRLGFV